MESNGNCEYFNPSNEEECFKRFKHKHDVAMGYVPRNIETVGNQDVSIWEQLQEAFPLPAWLRDRIEIGGIYYAVERPKFDCFKPVSFTCVCYKCVTANSAGWRITKKHLYAALNLTVWLISAVLVQLVQLVTWNSSRIFMLLFKKERTRSSKFFLVRPKKPIMFVRCTRKKRMKGL